MTDMVAARLLIDPPMPGAINMARDEAPLQACVDPNTRPVVRFYAWDPATVSLGFFQDYAEYQRLSPPAGDLPVVRRTTGGGAILHDMELTYSIVIPLKHPLVAGRPNDLYTLAHKAIIAAIGHGVRMLGDARKADPGTSAVVNPQSSIVNRQSAQRGPFFCFARRHGLDVVVDEPRTSVRAARQAPTASSAVSKVAGSAQRRSRTAILQHGSIMLAARYRQQPVATWSQLEGRLSDSVQFDEAAARLRPAFEEALGMRFSECAWQTEELAAAAAIERQYAGEAWTVHRKRLGIVQE